MATRTKKAEEAVEEVVTESAPPEASVAPTAEEAPLDAVIIVRSDNPRGGLPLYEVILNGRMQPEGVQTAIELGLKSWREQIGLDG